MRHWNKTSRLHSEPYHVYSHVLSILFCILKFKIMFTEYRLCITKYSAFGKWEHVYFFGIYSLVILEFLSSYVPINKYFYSHF